MFTDGWTNRQTTGDQKSSLANIHHKAPAQKSVPKF